MRASRLIRLRASASCTGLYSVTGTRKNSSNFLVTVFSSILFLSTLAMLIEFWEHFVQAVPANATLRWFKIQKKI